MDLLPLRLELVPMRLPQQIHLLFKLVKFTFPLTIFVLHFLLPGLLNLLFGGPHFLLEIFLDLPDFLFMLHLEFLLFTLRVRFGSDHVIFNIVDLVFHFGSDFLLGLLEITLALGDDLLNFVLALIVTHLQFIFMICFDLAYFIVHGLLLSFMILRQLFLISSRPILGLLLRGLGFLPELLAVVLQFL